MADTPNRRAFVKDLAAATASALTLGSCAGRTATTTPDTHQPVSDVVVILPGIMGSVLRKDGKDVWAVSGGAVLDALRTLGRSVNVLTLRGDSEGSDDVDDGVTATSLIQDTHLFPGLSKIDGYTQLSRLIKKRFAVEGQNYFEFPYDWRRDNRLAARQLARRSHQWLKAWRQRSGKRDAKLILIAHSMGGELSRSLLKLAERDGRASYPQFTGVRGIPT
jgi:hypothetical protein